ncbi:hypothetical protein D3C86_2262880 [compost metagenome]
MLNPIIIDLNVLCVLIEEYTAASCVTDMAMRNFYMCRVIEVEQTFAMLISLDIA